MSRHPERAVLVTGASKGIGHATALLLDRGGYRVYAGYRDEADASRLREAASRALVPVRLDVTSDRDVAAVAGRIDRETGPSGLWGVVNNAGIVVPGPLELLPAELLREQLEVNVEGPVRVIQATVPLLRRARGRIVNVSSVNGRLATPWAGAYAMSKFALEALSDTLRAELRRWGIDVIVVQPGAIRTPIWETSRERAIRMMDGLPPERRELYGGILSRLRGVRVPDRALDADRVARVIATALTVRRPRMRYRVGLDATVGILLGLLVPGRLLTALLARRRPRAVRSPDGG